MMSLGLSVVDDELPSTWAKIKEFYFLDSERIDVTQPETIQGLINVSNYKRYRMFISLY